MYSSHNKPSRIIWFWYRVCDVFLQLGIISTLECICLATCLMPETEYQSWYSITNCLFSKGPHDLFVYLTLTKINTKYPYISNITCDDLIEFELILIFWSLQWIMDIYWRLQIAHIFWLFFMCDFKVVFFELVLLL